MSKTSTTGANEKELSDLRTKLHAAEARAASPYPGMTWPELLRHTQMERDTAVDKLHAAEARAASLEQELAPLRETNKRLNRRCQIADAAVNTKVEDFEKRSTRGLRAYYFNLGKIDAEQRTACIEAQLIDARRKSLSDAESIGRCRGQLESVEATLTSVEALLVAAEQRAASAEQENVKLRAAYTELDKNNESLTRQHAEERERAASAEALSRRLQDEIDALKKENA